MKTSKNIMTTVLLMAGALLAACSSENDIIDEGLNGQQDGVLMHTPVRLGAA